MSGKAKGGRKDTGTKRTKGRKKKRTPFMRLDLHIHSKYSIDSPLTVRTIARRAKAIGLGGFALTDHNSVRGHRRFADVKGTGLLMVPGIEISAIEGHILAYGISSRIPRGLSTEETVDRIIAAGGMPVAAHPYRKVTGIGEKAVHQGGFKVVEVFNGRTTTRNNRKAVLLASKIAAGVTGGSDSHSLEEIGNGYTIVFERVDTVDDLLECIRKGRTRAEGTEPPMSKVVTDATGNVYNYFRRGMKRT
jgi:predicted metal-dependent phosphoesterase TrpH